jgi:DNA-binding MurR/RpiR family transcriptional regulator
MNIQTACKLRSIDPAILANKWVDSFIQLLDWTHELLRDKEYAQAAATLRAARLIHPNYEVEGAALTQVQVWLDRATEETATFSQIRFAKEVLRSAQELI